MQATFLGCGDAFAVPRPGCPCPQCAEARLDPRQARTRSGMLLRTAEECVLLDCSPDVARQLERQGLGADAITRVVISHRHNDHCYGLYDLARLRLPAAAPLRVHANAHTQATLRAAFPSLFKPEKPSVAFETWGRGVRLELDGLALEGFETHHYPDLETTAFLLETTRAGVLTRIAYATDMGDALPSPAARLEGVDLFVGDGTYLGEGGHGHPGTARVVEVAARLGAGRVAITHVGHWGVRAAEAAAALGGDVAICRDGDDVFSFLA